MVSNKKEKKDPLDYMETWNSFSQQLNSESEQCIAVVAASFFDAVLKRTLADDFGAGNCEARGKLFSDRGAFSTFSSKIDCVFCSGKIDTGIWRKLHLIRKIRNSFAHQLHGTSMGDEEISRLIDNLVPPGKRNWTDISSEDYYFTQHELGLTAMINTLTESKRSIVTFCFTSDPSMPDWFDQDVSNMPNLFWYCRGVQELLSNLQEHLDCGPIRSREDDEE